MTNPFKTQEVSGTSTEKTNLAGTLTEADADFVFRIVGGDRYKWNGSAWEQISTAGARHTTSPGWKTLQADDGTYHYYGEAIAGTATSAAAWRVSRVTNATGDEYFAGTGAMDQVWDNYASLSYT